MKVIDVKTFEIRDNATKIPVMAVKIDMYALDKPDFEQFRDAGWAADEREIVYVIELPTPCRAAFDPFDWQTNSRTFCDAHIYIKTEWDKLVSGQVIDVEFINGEKDTCKDNEWKVRHGLSVS